MFGLFNRRSRRPRRRRGTGRRAEQMEMAFVEAASGPGSMSPGPFTPRALLAAPEPETKKAFLRMHGPKIKAMVTEAWRAATPDQRSRISYPTCRTAAWAEYQAAEPGADIEVVIQDAILKCAYGRALSGTYDPSHEGGSRTRRGELPEWYITGEATREDLGLERGFTKKELSKQQRAARLRLYQSFQEQFKPVIEVAAKEAKISMKEAKAFAWRSANAGVTDPEQLGRMIVRLGKVDKMASSGKISTRDMTPQMRAALKKPAGASCVSQAGKRAALKILVKPSQPGGLPKAELAKLLDGGSKDTLLYMLQASVSPAAKPNKTRTRAILTALAKKGVGGKDLRGNLKKAVGSSIGATSVSAQATAAAGKKKAASSSRGATSRTSASRSRTNGKPKASSAVRTAFKKQMKGKATKKDKELIAKHNAKVRAHKAGAGKSTSRTSASASRTAASRSRTSSSKPKASAAVKAAFKKQMKGKATKKDKELIKKHNAKVRAHKAGAKGSSSGSRTTQASRVAESRGVSDWALFVSHWSGEVRKARVPGKKVFKVLSHAFTKLKAKDKTRAQQKPIIKKAIADYKAGKIKGAGKSLVSAAAAQASASRATTARGKKKNGAAKPTPSAAVSAAFKKQMAGKASKKDKELIKKHNAKVAKAKATVPASVSRTSPKRKTGTDSYQVSGSITIKG